MAVARIGRICLICADGDSLARFYRQAFGFESIGTHEHRGASFARLVGIEAARARARVLRLGGQTLELLTFTRPGSPYPAKVASDDPRFQHFAVVVADMAAAYDRLRRCTGWSAITRSTPQRLPVRSGGVSAFKFRDPEGHPLELLAFPPETAPAHWQRTHQRTGCIGIDHSAIAVADTARSIDFYERLLGFSVCGRSLNHGRQQAQLDNLLRAVVEVTALQPRSPAPPHLELLCYRALARGKRPQSRANDIAATQLVLQTSDLLAVMRGLTAAKARFISMDVEHIPGRRSAALVQDPDGHLLRLESDSRQ